MKIVTGCFVLLLGILLFTGCPTPESGSSGSSSGSQGSSGGSGDGESTTGIAGFSASKYVEPGAITLTWRTVLGADQYKIYRYESRDETSLSGDPLYFTDNTPDLVDEAETIDIINDAANHDKVFFYKIAYFIDGVESEKSDFVYGVCNADRDSLEPQSDTKPKPFPEAGQTVFKDDILSPPYVLTLYSYPDGTGSEVSDVDWYKFRCTRTQMIDFRIETVSATANINSGDIQYEFYYGSDTNPKVDGGDTGIVLGTSGCRFGDQPDHYGQEADDGELVDVYFRLAFRNPNPDTKRIFKYKVVM